MASTTQPQIVVVGVDYSQTGELALAQAVELTSSAPGAELHAIHVVSTLPALTGFENVGDPAPSVTEPGDAQRELERHLDRALCDFASRRDASLPLPGRVVGHIGFSAAAEEITNLARELEAILVVVGTHGRRGFSRVLLGSVAEGVVRLAPCPVLVVRPRELSNAPRIEPPCEHCLRTRVATGGRRQWCKQHSERHGPRHTYHQRDRIGADGGMPLIFRN